MASLFRRKGSPYWWLRHKVDGKWKNEPTGLHYDDERETRQAELIRAKWSLKESRESGRRGKRGYSWAWVDDWLQMHCKIPKTLAAYKLHWKHIRHWITYVGLSHPQDVTFKHGHDFVTWRTGRMANHKTCSRNTALLEVKLLGQILKQAALRGDITASPLTSLGIAKEEAKEKRELTDEEIKTCLAAFEAKDEEGNFIEPEWMRLAFLISLHTGCRLRETPLLLSHVDFERMTITFPAPKGGRNKAFSRPLPAALAAILAPLRGRAVTHEIPFQPSRCFQNFFKRVNIEGVSFHCLRVTYITRLHRAGVPLAAAMRLVNHSSEAVHRIYRRLNVDDVRQFADVPLFATTPQSPGA